MKRITGSSGGDEAGILCQLAALDCHIDMTGATP
jgi:hypothetical protein